MRKAVVNADGFVVNVIEIEDGANWKLPDDCYLVDAEKDGSPGDTWDGEKFIKSEPTPIPTALLYFDKLPAGSTAAKRLDNIEAFLETLYPKQP